MHAALVTAGIQVWMDESELTGGDTWDSKIRSQIEACSLFVALISANTNARLEGYFRKEWKLAVERTHGMHESLAFLLPVVIDDTTDAAALVPDKFRQVQWTKLPGGEATPAFVDKLTRVLLGNATFPGPGGIALGEPKRRPSSTRQRPWVVAALAVFVIAALGAWIAWPRKVPVNEVAKVADTPAGAGAVILPKSIAVLPFVNMSEDKGNAYFADGVQEDILTNLALIGDMNVISRTSVMAYRDTLKPTQQIARELGVAYVLEGSVQRDGKKVRVTGQLIDGKTGLHVWAHAYDRELDNVLEIQELLSKEIADALHARLTPQDLARLESKATDSGEAYDLLLRGRSAYRSSGNGTEDLEKALRYFEQAVALDPKFADAWLEIAWIYRMRGNDNPSPENKVKRAEAMAAAKRFAPDSLELLSRVFFDAEGDGDWVTSAGALKRMVSLYPNSAGTVSAQAAYAQDHGDTRSAAAYFSKACSLDPRDAGVLIQSAQFDLQVRKFDEASVAFTVAGSIWPAKKWDLFRIALIPFFARGDAAPAETLVSTFSPESLRDDPESIAPAVEWSYIKGDSEAVIRIWENGGSHFVFNPFSARGADYPVAEALLAHGEPERARPILEKFRDEAKAKLEAYPNDEGALSELMNALYRLHANDEARQVRKRLVGLHPEDEDDIISQNATWSGEASDKDAGIARLALILRHPLTDAWRYNVHCMSHSIHMWPLQGDPRFEALIKDPANNAPTI
jgi:TolB-like protein